MNPEDSVFVGVINRQKDFALLREQQWYRVPEGKAPQGIYAHYVAFFFSRAFGELNGAIHYYAQRHGEELRTRADLLPDEAKHPRAQARYHMLKLGELKAKVPPIRNPTKRPISFIYTTWDRFIHAETIADLYSDADHLVDRFFHILQDAGLQPQRRWWFSDAYPLPDPQISILCEAGEVIASAYGEAGISLQNEDVNNTLDQIHSAVQAQGGPKLLLTPLDY